MTDPGRHFCTCKDLACPCNPNNPKNLAKGGLGCDACIRKNLARGEVPSCMFISLGDTSEWALACQAAAAELNRQEASA